MEILTLFKIDSLSSDDEDLETERVTGEEDVWDEELRRQSEEDGKRDEEEEEAVRGGGEGLSVYTPSPSERE